MISAKIVLDSVAAHGVRLTTFELNYPRCIHGEVMTHRVFSRNAMSSRAIPVAKMIDQVRHNPFIPLEWGMNQPGMQSRVLADDKTQAEATSVWLYAAESACRAADKLNEIGLHKQIVNRLLEPFQWMRTIVTATEWDNFFELRDHPDAEPHFQRLASAMRGAMSDSKPAEVALGCWHLPYISKDEHRLIPPNVLARISSARCARVSYLTHDGKEPSIEADLALYQRLAGSRPIHASPLEHQAFPAAIARAYSGNLRGWVQFRKLVEKGYI